MAVSSSSRHRLFRPLAAVLAEKLVGRPFPEQMRQVLFRPLRMASASLGLGGRGMAGTAHCQVPDDSGGWNSPYWRKLGSPWGGAHGNAADVTRLLRAFASGQAACQRLYIVAALLERSLPPGATPGRALVDGWCAQRDGRHS